MKQKNQWWLVVLAMAVLFVVASSSEAKAASFDFNVSNFLPSSTPAPYGSVSVTFDTTNKTVTFTITGNYGLIGGFGFNTDLGLSASNFTTVPSGWNIISGKEMDGFGRFVWVERNPSNATRTNPATVILTLTNLSDLDISHFAVPNAGGYLFVAEMFPTTPIPGSTSPTGFIAVRVPEPSLVLLLGIGLGAITLLGLRFRA